MFCKIKQSTVLILGQMKMNAKVDIFLPRPTYLYREKLLIKKTYTYIVQCTFYIVVFFFCYHSKSDQKSIVWNPDSGFSLFF